MDCVRDGHQDLIAGLLQTDATPLFTPLVEAVAEIHRRRERSDLKQQVEAFLHGDLPDYLRGPQPVLYLARHVATPNFETLRFAELARPFGLPMVIGQDTNDKFVAHNAMKCALGKLPVQRRNEHAQLETITVIDFAAAQGVRLRDVVTLSAQPLPDFHAGLMRMAALDDVQVTDDAAWIDRQQRGNLLEHYKRFLALFVAHGVMLENYEDEDAPLVRDVLEPAFAFIEWQFGVAPLICDLAAGSGAHPGDWNAYPGTLRSHLQAATDAGQ